MKLEYGIFLADLSLIDGLYSTPETALEILNAQVFVLHNQTPEHYIICSVYVKGIKYKIIKKLYGWDAIQNKYINCNELFQNSQWQNL